MLFSVLIILIIIIIFYSSFSGSEYFTMSRIKSTIDYNEYSVVDSYADKQEAANLIAQINVFTIMLIKQLNDVYSIKNESNITNKKELEKGQDIAQTLVMRFNSKSLQENEPENKNKTSYVTNKGDTISLCLREKLSGENKFHNIEDLKFVTIHELSHIITPELSHTPLFWTNFKFMLMFCAKYKIYDTPNYDVNNVNYCGLTVSYNPINDKTLDSYF